MTLAGRCDNQAIGGFRHIKWGGGGKYHGTHVARPDFFTTRNHHFCKGTVGLVMGRREAGAMGGGEDGLLLLHGIWCGCGIKSPLHIQELGTAQVRLIKRCFGLYRPGLTTTGFHV
jgi:hypothetical protein